MISLLQKCKLIIFGFDVQIFFENFLYLHKAPGKNDCKRVFKLVWIIMWHRPTQWVTSQPQGNTSKSHDGIDMTDAELLKINLTLVSTWESICPTLMPLSYWHSYWSVAWFCFVHVYAAKHLADRKVGKHAQYSKHSRYYMSKQQTERQTCSPIWFRTSYYINNCIPKHQSRCKRHIN